MTKIPKNREAKLVSRDSIEEELRPIKGSETDYITPTGKVYKDFGNNMMFPKNNFPNKHNGYLYTTITYPEGHKQRRVHKLVAEAYIPNPENYPYVMHKDDNKQNPNVENLQWGSASMNTKDAFDHGLVHNDKGFDDSQSIPVSVFDRDGNFIKSVGSIRETAKEFGVTMAAVRYQCNHNMKSKPRKGHIYKYMSECEEEGFVL